MVFYPVSAFFLLLCLGITLAVPTLRSSMFGYMKISFLISISSFFIFMTAMAYGGLSLILDHPLICRFIGYLTNFLFLASFFWLNTMSFDIWRTFSNMRAYGSMIHRIRSKRRRIVQYTFYAWGLPALITLVSLIVDLSPMELILPRPDHGTRTCFFNNRAAKVAYQQVHLQNTLRDQSCSKNPSGSDQHPARSQRHLLPPLLSCHMPWNLGALCQWEHTTAESATIPHRHLAFHCHGSALDPWPCLWLHAELGKRRHHPTDRHDHRPARLHDIPHLHPQVWFVEEVGQVSEKRKTGRKAEEKAFSWEQHKLFTPQLQCCLKLSTSVIQWQECAKIDNPPHGLDVKIFVSINTFQSFWSIFYQNFWLGFPNFDKSFTNHNEKWDMEEESIEWVEHICFLGSKAYP